MVISWPSLLFCFLAVFAQPVVGKPKVVIRAGGATLPLEIYKVWKPVYQAYRSSYIDLDLTYAGTGSGQGVAKFTSGDYDYAGSDAELADNLYVQYPDYQMFPVMAGPVSLAYNIPEMPASCSDYTLAERNPKCLHLSRDVLVQIFIGGIKAWNDPRLVALNPGLQAINQTITVIVRADGSGTTGIFTHALQTFSPYWNGARDQQFTDGCSATGKPLKWNPDVQIRCGAQGRGTSSLVANIAYSMGYMGPSDARDTSLPEAILQNQAGFWVGPTVASAQAAMDASSSDLGARMTGSMVNAPGNKSYPISGYTYFLIHMRNMTNCTLATELLRMFQYVLQDPLAQSIALDMAKAPLSRGVYDQVKKNVFDVMECRGKKVADLLAHAIAIEDGSWDAWKLPVEIVVTLTFVAVIFVLAFLLYVKYEQNKNALRNTFLVSLNRKDVDTKSHKSTLNMSSARPSIGKLEQWVDNADDSGEVVKQANGMNYWVRDLCLHVRPFNIQWATRVQLVKLKDKIAHENVLKLLGITQEDDVCWKLVTDYPAKGRLQDILHVKSYYMDTVFRNSIVSDVAQGMAYLHKSGIIHGQLTSNSCYVDTRWTVVVGDWEQFALHTAQKETFVAFERAFARSVDREVDRDEALNDYHRSLFWSAPEVLEASTTHKNVFVVTNPTKACDIFSYGVVFYETFTDMVPYADFGEEEKPLSAYQIVESIQAGDLLPVIPPQIAKEHSHVVRMLTTTWYPEPGRRSPFPDIIKKLRQANPKQKSIVDSMMQAVESYASSLEEKVEVRTRDLEKLTKNMEQLLHSMMPATIADKLSRGEHVEPESYESCTLFFSDIVGFTSIAAASAPMDIVLLLNELYSAFDGVIERFDVYKVETIGDSYMCVSGLPHRNGTKHADQIAVLSLNILHTVMSMTLAHMPEQKLRVRIGAHSGSVMAGVVGVKMPRYCLFGDAVNTASRMESSSLPMRIQISSTTKDILDSFDGYLTCLRGTREIKGKGAMTTYWLTGKEGFASPLPRFDPAQDQELLALLDANQVK